jgi:uncharacterized protein (DUF983 family)
LARQPHYGRVSPISAGLRGACPRCGRGKLFSGYISPARACENCGLDYGFMDSGDGPAVFVILIAGFVVVGLALVVEVSYQPSYWVHAVLWLPLAVLLPLLLLRPFKGILLCLQYHHRAEEGRVDRP